MANKFYHLNAVSLQDWLALLAESLTNKYGDWVTIHIVDSSQLVFTCPAISEKSIRVTNANIYYGSVSAGGTFTSESVFFYLYSGSIWSYKYLILGERFFLLTGTDSYTSNVLIAKTESDISLFLGSVGHETSSRHTNNNWHAFSQGTKMGDFDILDFGRPCLYQAAVPYKSPLLLLYRDAQGDQLLRKQDGTPDTIEGLYMAAYSAGSPLLVNGGLFSATGQYSAGSIYRLRTSLLAEF